MSFTLHFVCVSLCVLLTISCVFCRFTEVHCRPCEVCLIVCRLEECWAINKTALNRKSKSKRRQLSTFNNNNKSYTQNGKWKGFGKKILNHFTTISLCLLANLPTHTFFDFFYFSFCLLFLCTMREAIMCMCLCVRYTMIVIQTFLRVLSKWSKLHCLNNYFTRMFLGFDTTLVTHTHCQPIRQ